MSGGLPSWARKGMKVVCVDDYADRFTFAGPTWTGSIDGLTAGRVYTIRAVFFDALGGACLRLVEIRRLPGGSNSIYFPGVEAGFALQRFRPAVDETALQKDVAYFKDLINQPVRESEPA